MTEKPIGKLVHQKDRWTCVCFACTTREEMSLTSDLYPVNIGPYKQDCFRCGKLLVEGKTPAWCRLYNDVVQPPREVV